MKSVIIALVLAVSIAHVNCEWYDFILKHMVFNKAETEEAIKISLDCQKETNVNVEVFDQLDKGELPEVRELKCFFRCFALKFGTLKENGDIDLTRLETTTRKKQYDIIEECSKIKADDLCDQIYEVHKCYARALKKHNIVL